MGNLGPGLKNFDYDAEKNKLYSPVKNLNITK